LALSSRDRVLAAPCRSPTPEAGAHEPCVTYAKSAYPESTSVTSVEGTRQSPPSSGDGTC
jgi:hypothetical protein